MNKVIKFILGLSVVSLLIESIVALGYAICTGLSRVPTADEKELPDLLLTSLDISAIVFLSCVFLMCIFEIMHIYKIHGIKGIVVIGIILAVVFSGSFMFNKVLLKEDNSLIQSIKLTLGIMMLGLMISSYNRIKKEK